MRVAQLVLPWGWLAACAGGPEPFECLDVPLEACDLTPECRLSVAHRARIDPQSGFSCWEGDVVPVACQPDFAPDRCPDDRVSAGGPSGDVCLLFDDVCTPEDWVPCEPPATSFCPLCESLDLGPFYSPSMRLTGMDGLGAHLAVGDLDDDGVDDLAVSGVDGVVVYFGPIGPDSDTLTLTSGDRTVDEETFLTIGDLDGDGVVDLVIGAPRATRVASTARHGQVAWHRGPLAPGERALLSGADLQIEGDNAGSELGAGLWIADLDGDEAADLLVTARGMREGGGGRLSGIQLFPGPFVADEPRLAQELSTVRVVGSSSIGRDLIVRPATEDLVGAIVGDRPGGALVQVPFLPGRPELNVDDDGILLGRVRDLDGAGQITRLAQGALGEGGGHRIVVGMPAETGVYETAGRVAVLAPDEGADAVPDARLRGRGRCDGDRLGTALAVGDLNDDGFDDLVIGTERGTNMGGLIVWGPLAADEDDQRWSDVAPRLGVAGWGEEILLIDVDGDGALDVVAGAPDRSAVLVFLAKDLDLSP